MRKPLPGKGRAALFFVAVLAVAAYFAYDFFLAPKPEHKSYAEFYSLVADGRVGEAVLSAGGISFTVTGDESAGGASLTEYQTDNPASPTLKEYLLLHGVNVKEEKDVAATISLLFDIVFYLFFFSVFRC